MHSYVNILRLVTDTSCFLHREIRLSPTINILYLYLLERYRPILWVTCFGWTLLLEKMVDWKNLEEDMEDFVSQISSHLIKPSCGLDFGMWMKAFHTPSISCMLTSFSSVSPQRSLGSEANIQLNVIYFYVLKVFKKIKFFYFKLNFFYVFFLLF
jgi:hypothetical protein